MTVVSNKEFKNHQDKYLRLALDERVFIKKGNHTFYVTTTNNDKDNITDLALARERRNGEFTSSDEFILFMENTINNGIHSREESL